MPIVMPTPIDRPASTASVEHWRRRRVSQVYLDLNRLLRALHEVQIISRRLIDGKHGDACHCPYCRYAVEPGHVAWLMGQIAGGQGRLEQLKTVLRDHA